MAKIQMCELAKVQIERVYVTFCWMMQLQSYMIIWGLKPDQTHTCGYD